MEPIDLEKTTKGAVYPETLIMQMTRSSTEKLDKWQGKFRNTQCVIKCSV